MADVKWIKITTDIFDDEKILLIESLPEADSIIVIWFKLLCLAGKMNNSGVFLMNDKIPYTDKMLATIFRRKDSVVKLALKTFEEFGMIQIVNGAVTIPNWGKHQNLDRLESKREYMKGYMRDYREKQKKIVGTGKYNDALLPVEEWRGVLTEFGYRCAYCGSKGDLEQDHVIPVSNGGKCVVGNIVPACRKCNASKGDKEVFSWLEKQDFFSDERCKVLRKYLHKTKCKANVSEADIDIDKDIDIDTDKEREIIPSSAPASDSPKKKKHKYGIYKNVLLTDEELEKLKAEFPDWEQKIENLSEAIESKGYKYKSHYATIRVWARKDAERNRPQNPIQSDYDMIAAWARGEA